jgi:hypothetical protein
LPERRAIEHLEEFNTENAERTEKRLEGGVEK